jgi:hypothetical protein
MTVPRFHFDLLLSCVIMSVVVFIKLCARMPAMGFLRWCPVWVILPAGQDRSAAVMVWFVS